MNRAQAERTSVLRRDKAADIACAVQNPEHFDCVLHRPVIDDVRRHDKAPNARPQLVAALADVGKADVYAASFQDGIHDSVGRIGIIRCDIGPQLIEVRFRLIG